MSLVAEWVRQLEFMVGVVSSIPSGGNFIFADFETPRCQFCTKIPEVSDLCYLGKLYYYLNPFSCSGKFGQIIGWRPREKRRQRHFFLRTKLSLTRVLRKLKIGVGTPLNLFFSTYFPKLLPKPSTSVRKTSRVTLLIRYECCTVNISVEVRYFDLFSPCWSFSFLKRSVRTTATTKVVRQIKTRKILNTIQNTRLLKLSSGTSDSCC